MLIAAVFLGLLAVFFARTFLVPSQPVRMAGPVVQTVAAVVAAQPFAFGEKIGPEKLKVAQWPAGSVPAGSFQRVSDAIGAGDRVALRTIDTNELLTEKAISGKAGRLSASPLFAAEMRAMAIPLNEAGGAGGFLAPGDRVDVYLTRTPSGEIPPYTTVLVQNARVLAVGQDANVAKDKPEIVHTATIELTPRQAEKVALAQSVGTLSLSLRTLVDQSSTSLSMVRLEDLHDGLGKLVLPRAPPPPTPPAAAAAEKPKVPTIDVEIIRGGKPTTYSLGPAR